MSYRPKKARFAASARYAPVDMNSVRRKPIIVSTGRGDSRLTVDEAEALLRDLAAALLAASREGVRL